MNGPQIYWQSDFSLPVLGQISINETMVNAWIVMAIILLLCIFLTSRMEKVPRGKQALAEKAVLMVDGLVKQNMGESCCKTYSPFVTTLLLSSVLGSLMTLLGRRAVTADLNTTLGWALIVFFLITYSKIRHGGFLGYLKSFADPIFIMAPLNILSEIATPVSMSFRHFGNMAGGLVITTLLLQALAALSGMLHLPIPLFQIGLPGVLSLYFDLFTACMQAFIFSMLTMAYVGSAREG